MAIYAQQLPSGKWGLYSKVEDQPKLIATVACKTTCATIMANLKSGRRDIPDSDTHQLYQLPQLKHNSRMSQPGNILKSTLPAKNTLPAADRKSQRATGSPRKLRKRGAQTATPKLTSNVSRQGRTLVTAKA
ncbi:MAG: hypothetical protein AAFV85_08585 [Cyanobacteria bacterium J06634_6]